MKGDIKMIKKELPHFQIDGAYGGSQDWFTDPMMNLGGCAAATTCDCCIYFDRYFGTHLYPFELNSLTREDYLLFSEKMKPYLRPRWTGINTLELFMDGVHKYFHDAGEHRILMQPFSGELPYVQAQQKVLQQIDDGIPIPYLNLHHRNPVFHDYDWHWFLLNGYETWEDTIMVKAVTYGSWKWLNFRDLWDSGRKPKGGMVLFQWNS